MVLDVVQQLHFALIRRQGNWERLEHAELRRFQEDVRRLNRSSLMKKLGLQNIAGLIIYAVQQGYLEEDR